MSVLFLRLDELFGIVEEHVGAKAGNLLRFAVVPIAAIEVGVVPVIGCLPDASTAVTHDFGVPAVLRSIGIVVAQVPLAKHAGGIAVVLEDLAHRDFVLTQHRSTHDRVPNARPIGPVPGQECGSSRRAGRSDMVVHQSDRLGMELVDLWRLQDRIAETGEVSVALVVRDHDHDVGFVGGTGHARHHEKHQQLAEEQAAPDQAVSFHQNSYPEGLVGVGFIELLAAAAVGSSGDRSRDHSRKTADPPSRRGPL